MPTLFTYTDKEETSLQTVPSNALDDMDYANRVEMIGDSAVHWKTNKPCASVKVNVNTEKLTFFAKAVEEAFGEKIPQFLK